MGYEVTLKVGWLGGPGKEAQRGDLCIEDGEAWKPYKKDDEGNYLYTGRIITHFVEEASLDLCKPGYGSEICSLSDVDRGPDDPLIYWYRGSLEETTDSYGREAVVYSLEKVISALESDNNAEEYHRYYWAIQLLKAVKDKRSRYDMKVILIGH